MNLPNPHLVGVLIPPLMLAALVIYFVLEYRREKRFSAAAKKFEELEGPFSANSHFGRTMILEPDTRPENCGECRFFVERSCNGVGQCRRHAPGNDPQTPFPVVWDSGFCGEFERKSEEEAR